MTRPAVTLAAALLALVLGLAGLARGAMPQADARGDGSTAPPGIYVSGAYVREPANDVNAAAYFTVFNTTAADDVLTSVDTGAGETAGVHTDDHGAMVGVPELTVPAHGSITLEPGKYHVMIDKLYGPLRPGTTVNLELEFRTAGQVLVTAPVVALGAPAPTAEEPK